MTGGQKNDSIQESTESPGKTAVEPIAEADNSLNPGLNEQKDDLTIEENDKDVKEDNYSEETYTENEEINSDNEINQSQTIIEQADIPPELELNIILGPEYAQDSQVCYYRVRAGVKGDPYPDISFSKDDSNGAWGRDVVQINLTKDQSYTLTCRAENSAGVAESSVVLNWSTNPNAINNSDSNSQTNPETQVDYGDIDNFLIDVNLTTQQVAVSYKGNVIKSMICSGGNPETPTPVGEYLTYQKIYYQYIPKYAQGAFYWTRFFGSYLFHSIPTDINRNMLIEEYEKLGTPASHGCIRLKNEDAKWMYDILPLGIKVSIHN